MSKNVFVQIVLVEDNDADAELSVRVLRQGAVTHPIVRLRSGDEALDFLILSPTLPPRLWPRRVVLLDLDLPTISGIDVLRALRHRSTTEGLPVVILTGYADDRIREMAATLGAMKVLPKPLTAESVTDIVRLALEHWNRPRMRETSAVQKNDGT